MTTTELKRLNHYWEFRTNNDIDDIIHYIATGALPAGLNARQTTRYIQKFGAGSGFVARNHNTELFYNPNANINLKVVQPNQRQAMIQLVYNDIRRGLGKGLDSFYHQIAMSYLNITKTLTDDFLRQQGDYTVGIVPHKTVNKPIIASVPNERWGVDLINMEAYNLPAVNGSRRFILTVVDYFSGKVFARGLLNNRNNNAFPTLSNAMQEICNQAHTYPHIIQSDSEFAVGAFSAWCNNHNINLIKTTSYTPVSNGRVERMNREIRRKIKAGIVRNNNFVWNAFLQDYCQNINNQRNARSGLTANQLWSAGYNPHPPHHIVPPVQPLNDNMNNQQRKNYNEALIDNKARQTVASGRQPPVFHNGDWVRIKLLNVSNVMREIRERDLGWNKAAIHYTPEIYQVVNAIHHPVNFIRQDEYFLRDIAGNLLLSGFFPKRFYGNDLMLAPANHIPTHINPQTTHRALQLNRFV